ncbi:MAG: hypothetical protein ACYTEL_12665 [Planctomycetota bacterium]|jgi:hypothetical protein
MSKKDKTSDALEGVSSAFSSLLRLLRIPVPLASAICVAVMLGASTIPIQSFELPPVIAAVASVMVLIAVYLGAYRAALVLLRLLEEAALSADGEQVYSLCRQIRSESSLQNPFSSTRLGRSPESSITDYVGVVAIHIPMLVVLVCSFWALSEQRAKVTNALKAIKKTEAAMAQAMEADEGAARRQAAQKVLAAFAEEKESMRGLTLSTVYYVAAGVFMVTYFFFLWKISEVISVINYDDAFKRKLILGLSWAALAIPFEILRWLWMIRFIRFVVRVVSM